MASPFREIDYIPNRLFAVGDIHGCHSDAAVMLKHLEEVEELTKNDLVVFIGDYIDRGKESCQVIDLLVDFKSRFPETVFLKGNHEDMLLGFLGFKGTMGNVYLLNGGAETIVSYDISVLDPPEKIKSKLPAAHIEFFLDLEDGAALGDFIFVHAGLNPDIVLEEQSTDDMFWIRDEFILNVHSFKKTVIFGHTPHQDIFLHLPYKIGIDTGAVFGNMLTCIELRSKKVLQVLHGSENVKTGCISF